MRAVERKWGHDGTWMEFGGWLTEERMWNGFEDEIRHPTDDLHDGWSCLPLFVRYSNGQTCAFKRRRKETKP